MSLLDFSILFGILLVFVPGVFYFMSRIMGWSELSRRFPGRAPTELGRRTFGSVALKSALLRYNNCVRFIADEQCLHIRLLPPFCWLFHPHISIPWEKIDLPERAKRPARFSWTRIDVGGFSIWLPGAVVADEIELRSGASHAPSDGAAFEHSAGGG